MKFLKEFKEFAIKGNMFDMAIGIIIGAAFSKIVTSLVHDLIMPAIGFIIGKVNFQNLKIVLQEEAMDDSGNIVQELVAINYGNFIQVIFDFFQVGVESKLSSFNQFGCFSRQPIFIFGIDQMINEFSCGETAE